MRLDHRPRVIRGDALQQPSPDARPCRATPAALQRHQQRGSAGAHAAVLFADRGTFPLPSKPLTPTAVAVLTDMFGVRAFTDTTRRDHNLVLPLEPRSFGSFEEAAEEAASSRLYGGIHYPFGNHNGLTQGRCIGQAILDRVQFKR